MIQDTVDFTLGGLPGTYSVAPYDVWFHMGTGEPIPEPDSGILFCTGALLVGFAIRRRLSPGV